MKQTEVLCARCDFKSEETREQKGLLDSRPAFKGRYNPKVDSVPSYPPILQQRTKASTHSIVPPLQDQSSKPNYLVFSDYQNIHSKKSDFVADIEDKQLARGIRTYSQRGISVRSPIQYHFFEDEALSVSSGSISEIKSSTVNNQKLFQQQGRGKPQFQLVADVVELSSANETISVLTTV